MYLLSLAICTCTLNKLFLSLLLFMVFVFRKLQCGVEGGFTSSNCEQFNVYSAKSGLVCIWRDGRESSKKENV